MVYLYGLLFWIFMEQHMYLLSKIGIRMDLKHVSPFQIPVQNESYQQSPEKTKCYG